MSLGNSTVWDPEPRSQQVELTVPGARLFLMNPNSKCLGFGQGEVWKNHHGSAARDLQGGNETPEPDDDNRNRSGTMRFGHGERDQACVKSLIPWGDPVGEICHLLMLLLFDPLAPVNLVQRTHLPPSTEKNCGLH